MNQESEHKLNPAANGPWADWLTGVQADWVNGVQADWLTFAQARWLILATAIIVTATGCDVLETGNRKLGPRAAATVTQTVEVIALKPTDNAFEATTFFGTLKPRRNIPLAFTQGGRVAAINVVSGQQVTQDMVLAQTDIGDLESQKLNLESALDSAKQNLNTNQGSPEQRNRTNGLQKQLDDINREVDKATLTAPFAGTVARRAVEPGQVVSAGMPIMDLTDDGDPVIEANVATAIANGMRPDDQVWVLIADRPFQASVVSVMPTTKETSRTRVVKLEFAPDQSVTDLNAGDAVEIRYWTETNVSGFWLPWEILQQQSSGLWTTLVIEQQDDQMIASTRTVDVVRLQDNLALVQGALNPNDQIIISGLNRIVPGQKVIVEQVENKIVVPGPFAASSVGSDSDNVGPNESSDLNESSETLP